MSGSAKYLPLSSSLALFLLLLSRSHGPSESSSSPLDSPFSNMLKMQHKNLEHDQPITSFFDILTLSSQEQLCTCRYVDDVWVKTRVQVFMRPWCLFVLGFIRDGYSWIDRFGWSRLPDLTVHMQKVWRQKCYKSLLSNQSGLWPMFSFLSLPLFLLSLFIANWILLGECIMIKSEVWCD